MSRRKTPISLDVLINRRLVGHLEKVANGAIGFQDAEVWLAREHCFAASLSLPRSSAAYRGAEIAAVFDNLLPDRDTVRRRVVGAHGRAGRGLLQPAGTDRARP